MAARYKVSEAEGAGISAWHRQERGPGARSGKKADPHLNLADLWRGKVSQDKDMGVSREQEMS